MPEIVPDHAPSPRTPIGWDTVRYRALSVDAAGNVNVVIVGGRVGMYRDYVHVRDVKLPNTGGGGFVLGAWQTRDINTEQADPGAICTIAANQITLQSGVYRCFITCPAFKVDRHQARLYDVTAGAALLIGTSERTWDSENIQTRSVVVGRFTLAIASVLEVQHQCSVTRLANGLGYACNFGPEVYTDAEFWREW